jgi:hypothetical protein
VAGGVGVSPPLAPAPVITMLLGEWRALLEAGRRLEEVSTQNRGHGKYANCRGLQLPNYLPISMYSLSTIPSNPVQCLQPGRDQINMRG